MLASERSETPAALVCPAGTEVQPKVRAPGSATGGPPATRATPPGNPGHAHTVATPVDLIPPTPKNGRRNYV